MNKMRYMSLLVAFFLLSCVAMSDVVRIGKDTYMITGTNRALGAGGGTLTVDLLKEAANYCAKQNKVLLLKTSSDKDLVFGHSAAQSEVIFRCLREDDPEFEKIEMDKVYPKTRIEIENK